MQKYEILEKCNENIEKAQSIIENPKINPIIKIMTKPLMNRIIEINQICSIDKYTICFIGKVGIGKSTAITNLFGLVDKNKLSVDNKLTEIPLLKTAEGRTTLCETEIFFTEEETKIKIDGIDESNFEEIVESFCMKILKKTEDDVDCSNEVQRVIKNMSGFPMKDIDKQKKYIDQVLGNQDYDNQEFYELAKKAILKKIDYSKRTKNEIIYSKENEIEAWIKNTTFNINDGKTEDSPYPSKITIMLSLNDIKVKIPSFINKIRDTRGIDGDGVREDINKICRDSSNICIICDGIKDYGNIVSEGFLKNQFIKQNHDLKFRNFVMGLEQGSQLSKANNADGRESGKDIKKEEALSNWNSLCLDENNIIFYNAFSGINYDSDEMKILKIDLEKYNAERESVLKNIETKFNNMYSEYGKELSDINHKLSIFNKNTIESHHNEKLNKLKLTTEELLSELKNNFDLLFKKLDDEIRYKISPGHIRGSVNRRGDYYNYNLYSQAKNISYEEFDSTVSSPLFHIQKKCNSLFSDNDIMEEALNLAITYKMDELYKQYRDQNADDYETILRTKIAHDDIWNEMQGYWGKKIKNYKYRDRVADTLMNRTKDLEILEKIIEKNNTHTFFEKLSIFLNLES